MDNSEGTSPSACLSQSFKSDTCTAQGATPVEQLEKEITACPRPYKMMAADYKWIRQVSQNKVDCIAVYGVKHDHNCTV